MKNELQPLPPEQEIPDKISQFHNSNTPKFTPWKEPGPPKIYLKWHKSRRKPRRIDIFNDAMAYLNSKNNPLDLENNPPEDPPPLDNP